MKTAGIFLISFGLIGIIQEKPPSKAEKEIESKFEELEKSIEELQKAKSVNVLLINDRKVNVGLIVLGLIFVLLD